MLSGSLKRRPHLFMVLYWPSYELAKPRPQPLLLRLPPLDTTPAPGGLAGLAWPGQLSRAPVGKRGLGSPG